MFVCVVVWRRGQGGYWLQGGKSTDKQCAQCMHALCTARLKRTRIRLQMHVDYLSQHNSNTVRK